MLEATAVYLVENRSVQVCTSRAQKQRFIFMLAIMIEGHKLKRYVIFKRKAIPKEYFAVGIIARVKL